MKVDEKINKNIICFNYDKTDHRKRDYKDSSPSLIDKKVLLKIKIFALDVENDMNINNINTNDDISFDLRND